MTVTRRRCVVCTMQHIMPGKAISFRGSKPLISTLLVAPSAAELLCLTYTGD